MFVEDEASVSEDDSQACSSDEEDGDELNEFEADFIDGATQPGGTGAKGCARSHQQTCCSCLCSMYAKRTAMAWASSNPLTSLS